MPRSTSSIEGALPAPNDREQTQWYFRRYVSRPPAGGADHAAALLNQLAPAITRASCSPPAAPGPHRHPA
ncbi:hypothetical protein C1X21_22540 [Pseudomonas sp. FW305-3-2-15-A-LB2]|nr:hypothetical protein C1X17_21025 [Pseudomonas sp. FW305-3-2-15-C-TSA2]PMV24542.1 hypothetical protein C1X22_21425 [Pseudomonas sp. DP16D-L5]PMV36678.1 hypothetical protein C1X21_22540 [Pseudomonas sp. FW305-3-2-15-A-LB2]PMV42670.1 hypothetical protein C1X16_22915 [Pseudomonas sp. FW305-3-2-15-C-R2A1]PMV49274.1 hypothetical protein C1X18_18960 [Pseudomonas sp. FW305-3-2-15-C-LB1]PMV52776.1 hypothetical protein C1X19_22240 [Pseudomonas sp. GW460-4]PMV56964.1 hypothetical protein C1X20_27995 